ncbi:LCR-like protein [Medicago truncatula]|uniref:LCR-like protein n=1 Tax=Medicago truncatula TaxID=3880 RepID=A0A072UBJ1_MEDTR|nr:LCR-like protein [Medicago truncatula]
MASHINHLHFTFTIMCLAFVVIAAKAAVINPGPCFFLGACPDDSEKCHQFCKTSKGIDKGKCHKDTNACCCNNIG